MMERYSDEVPLNLEQRLFVSAYLLYVDGNRFSTGFFIGIWLYEGKDEKTL